MTNKKIIEFIEEKRKNNKIVFKRMFPDFVKNKQNLISLLDHVYLVASYETFDENGSYEQKFAKYEQIKSYLQLFIGVDSAIEELRDVSLSPYLTLLQKRIFKDGENPSTENYTP